MASHLPPPPNHPSSSTLVTTTTTTSGYTAPKSTTLSINPLTTTPPPPSSSSSPPPPPPPSISTCTSTTNSALQNCALSFLPDLPLLMYGSGDVNPSRIHPTTLAILAELTAAYICNLVDAAVESHDVLTDGAGGLVPPPPHSLSDKCTVKKRKREELEEEEDDWESPLPPPKIKTRSSSLHPSSSPPPPSKKESSSEEEEEWVGISPLDFFSTSRTRKPYASTPYTISTQSFIFPICHDAALYGRVMEVQAARRMMEPILVDDVIMSVVAEEGVKIWEEGEGKVVLVRKQGGAAGGVGGASNNGENADGSAGEGVVEDGDVVGTTVDGAGPGSEAGGTGGGGMAGGKQKKEDKFITEERVLPLPPGREAKWPGLEDILPVHRF